MKHIIFDIGSSKVSLLELETQFKGFEINRFEEEPLNTSHGEHSPEDYVRALRALTSHISLERARIIVGLPTEFVATKFLELPFKDKRKMSLTYQGEVEDQTPFALEQVITDYTVTQQVGKTSTLLTAITPQIKIASHLKILEAAYIDPDVLAAPQVALYSLHQYIEQAPDCFAILDIGHVHSSLVILEGGPLQACRVITFGGLHISEHLQKTYKASLEDAENIKVDKGYLICEEEAHFNEDQKVFSKNLKEGLNPLVRDLNQTLTAFRSKHKKNVKKIYMTGGGSLLRNIDVFLTSELQVEIEKLSILKNLKYNHIAASQEIDAKVLPTLAIGIQSMSHDLPINLRKAQFSKTAMAGEWVETFKPMAQYAALFLLILTLNLLGRLSLQTGYSHNINEKVTSIVKKHHPQIDVEVMDDSQKLEKYLRLKNQETETKLELFGKDAAQRMTPLQIINTLTEILSSHPRENMLIQKLQISQENIKVEGISNSESGGIILRAGLQHSPYLQITSSDIQPLDPSSPKRKFTIELKVKTI
ncbi:MAG: pilus assembly protein PilM [Deltaproteobacteria bacterium]|nr:pilus assembly protein PilM [Deltaproteobacteria bacterium]